MTAHPDHKLRVLVFQLDENGRPRITRTHSFTHLSDATRFQMEVLARPYVVRADLLLLLNSTERAPSLVPTQ